MRGGVIGVASLVTRCLRACLRQFSAVLGLDFQPTLELNQQRMPMSKEKLVGIYEALKKGVFILASALIIFVALKNSLIWHLEQFWGASKTFWSNRWGTIYQLSGENDFIMHSVGSALVSFTAFVVFNAFFMFVDLTGRPKWMLQYRIQEERNVPINKARYLKVLKRVTFNVVIVSSIHFLLMTPAAMYTMDCGYELPSFPTAILHLIIFIIFEEIWFYYGHRMFHHPLVYKHIHKTHHELTDPFGIASIYCHPLEHFVVNLLPVSLGPILLGSHLATAWLWFAVVIATTTNSHSGYHLPFLPSPEAHNYHHAKFNQNFGVLGILDRLHNTDEGFRRTKAYERHILLLGLSPAKELIPDTPKTKDQSCSPVHCQ